MLCFFVIFVCLFLVLQLAFICFFCLIYISISSLTFSCLNFLLNSARCFFYRILDFLLSIIWFLIFDFSFSDHSCLNATSTLNTFIIHSLIFCFQFFQRGEVFSCPIFFVTTMFFWAVDGGDFFMHVGVCFLYLQWLSFFIFS